MKTVAQILQVPEHEHTMYTLDTYLAWCDSYAKDEKALQKLMANSKLFQWWNSVYRVLEDDFVRRMNGIENLKKDTVWDLYNSMTCKIASYYSKPLINQALKTKDYDYRSSN
jgi:hypothetical protein